MAQLLPVAGLQMQFRRCKHLPTANHQGVTSAGSMSPLGERPRTFHPGSCEDRLQVGKSNLRDGQLASSCR